MKASFLTIVFLFACNCITFAQKADIIKTTNGIVKIQPILHGSLVLSYKNTTIYQQPDH